MERGVSLTWLDTTLDCMLDTTLGTSLEALDTLDSQVLCVCKR